MKVEVDVLGSPVLNNPYGLCGRKATLKKKSSLLVAVLILVISYTVAYVHVWVYG